MLAAVCWGDVLRAQMPPQGSPAPAVKFVSFDAATGAEIKAIAGQIIPETEAPGADSAGVIWFIDRALAGYDKDKRDVYARGLVETQARRAELFPGSPSIERLTPGQRIELLKSIEKTEFFQQVRFHTVLGFFGHPRYGGNIDLVGWNLLGVKHAMHFEPPFGYYDAESGSAGVK